MRRRPNPPAVGGAWNRTRTVAVGVAWHIFWKMIEEALPGISDDLGGALHRLRRWLFGR